MLFRVLGFLALFLTAAQAQVAPSYPFNLTNGSTADATQVMSNFNSILNGVNSNAAHNGANTDITSLNNLSSLTAAGPVLGTNTVTARLTWTGSIVGGYNIASITRVGVGNYNIVFTTPLNNTDYQVILSTVYQNAFAGIAYCSVTPVGGTPTPKTTAGFNLICTTSSFTAVDASPVTQPIDIIVVGGR